MIETLKAAIMEMLNVLFTDSTVYDEDLPEDYQKPCFLINVKSQNYTNLLQGKFKNQVNFDISYYSNTPGAIKSDCVKTGQALLSGFDTIRNYHLKNKKAETLENILHFTFEVPYTVRSEETFAKMQKQQINTNI